jgi:hypothetical protein
MFLRKAKTWITEFCDSSPLSGHIAENSKINGHFSQKLSTTSQIIGGGFANPFLL